jgi:NAD(P)-dependent dehydrogenase (short-subunit alcohol dehydrogenase family)
MDTTASSPPTALITGASRGLGLALARSLAADGWRLIIDGRDAVTLSRTATELRRLVLVTAVPGDVASEEHRLALAGAAAATGGLDVVVHNASLLGPSPQPTLDDYPLEVLQGVYAVNVFGPLRLTQLLLPYLRRGARVAFGEYVGVPGPGGVRGPAHGTLLITTAILFRPSLPGGCPGVTRPGVTSVRAR